MTNTAHNHNFLTDSLPVDLRPGATNERFPVMKWSHIPELKKTGFSSIGVAVNIFCGKSIILVQHRKTEKVPRGGLGPISETLKYKGTRFETIEGATERGIREETGVELGNLGAFMNSQEDWIPYSWPHENQRRIFTVGRNVYIPESRLSIFTQYFQESQEVEGYECIPSDQLFSGRDFTEKHTFRQGAKGWLAETAFHESYITPPESNRVAITANKSPDISDGNDLDFDRIKGLWLRRALSSFSKSVVD